VGFIIVILAHTDLFTEYTTLAILPVLTGRARTRALARLWSFVYLGNMTGAAIFAFLLARLGTGMEIIELHALEEIAGRLIDHPWWAILLSATLVGWLMGLLSWLIASADETVSRILFIWIVTGAIGLGHLHHSVT